VPAATGGDGAALRRRQTNLTLLVSVAVATSTLGWWAGRGIQSPEEAARNAAPPPASQITVPVERRTLESTVVVRGDLTFAQAFDVSVDPDLGDGTLGAQVVTGRVPRAGARLAGGSVALEVSGRPVFLLQGTLPMYRALRPGSTGSDVRQLEQALRQLGHFGGTPDTVYDERTATAVGALYENAGYDPVGLSTVERQELVAAQGAVQEAEGRLRQARSALTASRRPPPTSELLSARAAVAQARLGVAQAVAARDRAVADGADATTLDALAIAVEVAEHQLALEQARLAELSGPRDASAQQRSVREATADLTAARATLAALRRGAGPRLPRGEVVFVPSLPRRVDKVSTKVGQAPAAPALSLTASALQVDAAVSSEERKLLTVGAIARMDDEASGLDLTGRVSAIADTPGTSGAPPGTYHVRIDPGQGDLTKASGVNLRITIPIETTAGEVLTVPLAALVTDAAGTVRVRVADGGRFTDVTVAVGLAAGGLAEVRPVEGRLAEGDLVVVGNAG
jgi:peptidoglycan hydrolase-like protein with peptidoglycan-binding domain